MVELAGRARIGGAEDTRSLDEVKVDASAAVATQFARLLGGGLPYQGQVIDIDGPSRADLSGMAQIASLVIAGQLPGWPDNVSKGWVGRENGRVPLPSPQAGLALALAASGYYSALVQHECDLIVDVNSAADAAAVAAVDVTAGWPDPAAAATAPAAAAPQPAAS